VIQISDCCILLAIKKSAGSYTNIKKVQVHKENQREQSRSCTVYFFGGGGGVKNKKEKKSQIILPISSSTKVAPVLI
jgi:hypothetical protein